MQLLSITHFSTKISLPTLYIRVQFVGHTKKRWLPFGGGGVRCGPPRAMASSFMRFLYHTQRRTTVGMTPLDEWSACRRDLYLTTHNTQMRKTSMPPVRFEPTISAGERPQTNASDRATTGTGVTHPSTNHA